MFPRRPKPHKAVTQTPPSLLPRWKEGGRGGYKVREEREEGRKSQRRQRKRGSFADSKDRLSLYPPPKPFVSSSYLFPSPNCNDGTARRRKKGGEIEVKRATHLNKFVFPSLRIRVDLQRNSSPFLAVFQICTLVAIRHFSTKEEKKRRKEKREREWSVGPILLPRFAPGEIFGGPDPFSRPGGGFAHIS